MRQKADPIDVPDNDAVKSIDISSIDGDKIELSEDGMKEILHIVRDAEPTRSQSINDQPTNLDAYGTIVINTNEESRFFITTKRTASTTSSNRM